MIEGCEDHGELVRRAMDPSATDAELEAYADQVVPCAACQRILAVGAGVHPAHLHQANDDERNAIHSRVRMDDAALERLSAELQAAPVQRWPWVVAAVALAAVALLAVGSQQADLRPIDPVPKASVANVSTGPDQLPNRDERAVVLPTPEVEDAVVMLEPEEEQVVEEWEAPPFEDLRGSASKGPAVRDLRLAVEGDAKVGSSVRLAVQSSSAEVVSLCVAGVENGVVWRGGVPAGRTVLTLNRRALRYSFPRTGRYVFSLSLGDRCAQPVHRLELNL